MKSKLVNYVLILAVVCTITAISSFSLCHAFIQKAVSNVSFNITEATKKTITLYKDYNGSWGSEETIEVYEGSTISSATDPSKTGYTFLGWRTSAPSNSTGSYANDFPVQYTTTQLNNYVVGNTNLTFYPIFKYNSRQVYTHSNNEDHYYDVEEDVTLNYRYLNNTYIGDKYLGVAGVVDASTYESQRDLITDSGIYRFYEDNDCAYIERKIGFKLSNNVWVANTNEYYRIYYWNNETNGWSSCITNSGKNVPFTGYTYIPATYTNFKFVRMCDANAKGWTKNTDYWNESNDLSVSGYGSNNIVYSTDLSGWDDWTGTWAAS